MKNSLLIVTGTNPNNVKGGIGAVLPGYLKAMEKSGRKYLFFPTYSPNNYYGRYILWLKQLLRIIFTIRSKRQLYNKIYIYSHAGARSSIIRESIIQKASKLMGAKCLFHNHAPQIDHYLKVPWKRFLFLYCMQNADRVIVLTEWWKKRLNATPIHKKTRVIYNPLTPFLESVANSEKKSHSSSDSILRILCMARIDRGKGIDTVIKAIKLLPHNYYLVVAGDGPEKAKIEHLIKDLCLDERVTLTGWVSGERKHDLLIKSDVFCLPSINDAFPISFVEAMAYGLPVIGVKYGGIPDMIKDNEVGFLAESQDPSEIASKLLKFHSKSTCKEMGRKAKKWVTSICSIDTVAATLDSTIDEI